jgi:hypothetical protein
MMTFGQINSTPLCGRNSDVSSLQYSDPKRRQVQTKKKKRLIFNNEKKG